MPSRVKKSIVIDMDIDFSPSHWEDVRRRYRAWWDGELGRPLISITVEGRRPARPEPELPSYNFHTFYDLDVPAEAIVDRWLYDIESCWFLGDAFPQIWPNFGPGILATFLGLELRNGEETVWFVCEDPDEPAALRLALDREAPWYRRLMDLCRTAVDRFEGQVQIGMTDLGGNLDILSSFRPGERLVYDLYDSPDEIKRLTREAHRVWWEAFEAVTAVLQPANPGYTAWTPLFSETPYYMLQCDFSYMIGPEMFAEFVRPELEATCGKLDHAFYHLDGPGQLPHLDQLLAMESLAGVQWIPGEGQPGVTQWPDVYRRITEAGKRAQFFDVQDERGIESLRSIADAVDDPSRLAMIARVSADDLEAAEALLRDFGA